MLSVLGLVQMCHGLDVSLHNGTAVAGDNRGRLHFLDPRQDKPFAAAAVHKKDKVIFPCHAPCWHEQAATFLSRLGA